MEQNEKRPPFAHWLFFHVAPALLIVALSLAALIGIVLFLKKEPEPHPFQKTLPAVEIYKAQPTAVSITVESQGSVEARIQTNLVAEVSGRIETVSPALYAGGFFKKGDVLATIDPTDYQANLATAKSRLAGNQLAFEQEKASSEQALEDWKAVGNSDSPSNLVLRKPQLEQASANLEAAQIAVSIAERDLERTQIKAPYDGRVQKKFIDIGQIANARNTQIASIYSVDTAEVRLAIPLSDTRFVDLPESYRDAKASGEKPSVTIESSYGGKTYQWSGVIDRSEGAVDPQTRLIYLVAKIDDPYRKDPQSNRPPLKIGSFVTAKIQGKTIENAYSIPRKALHDNDTVYIVSPQNTLEIRNVEVYQKTTDTVVLSGGIEPGELLCLTPLQYVVDGMEVQIDHDEEPSPEANQ